VSQNSFITRNQVGMGFWEKSWFSGSEAAAGTKTTPIEECTVESVNVSLPQNKGRIIFSSERDIDLYELEWTFGDGWSRRPMRKVKKFWA